jgi:hypothetical protein
VSVVAAQLSGADGSQREAEVGVQIEEEPARVLAQGCPKAAEDLQSLEDIVFEAMAGKAAALAQLAELWPKALSQASPARTEATREHYLRYALSIWRQLNAAEGQDDPQRGLHAMQVICTLFGQ